MKFVSTHQPTRHHHRTPSETQSPDKQQSLRHRLAADLQNQIGQALTTIKLNLASIQESPPDSPPPAKSLAKSISLVERTMMQVQSLVSDLRAAEPALSLPVRASF